MYLIVQKLKVPHIYFSNIDTQELPVGAKHINLVLFLQLRRLYSTFGTIFMFMKVRVRARKGENLFNDGNKKMEKHFDMHFGTIPSFISYNPIGWM